MSVTHSTKKSDRINRGTTLLEIVIYVALMAMLLVTVSFSLIQVSSIALETKAFRALRANSVVALGRMAHEIRLAQSTNTLASILDVNEGQLSINTTDASGNSRTVEFKVNGTNLEYIEDGVSKGFLTSNDVMVTALMFKRQVTAKGEAIKIELTLQNANAKNSHTEKFYNTVVMRGAY